MPKIEPKFIIYHEPVSSSNWRFSVLLKDIFMLVGQRRLHYHSLIPPIQIFPAGLGSQTGDPPVKRYISLTCSHLVLANDPVLYQNEKKTSWNKILLMYQSSIIAYFLSLPHVLGYINVICGSLTKHR